MSEPVKPNFLFIGPDKTGSSWMHSILAEHPQCYVPDWKDAYFFDRYYQRGLDWYLTLFDQRPPGTRVYGELSHDYIFCPAAAERIAADLPEVRLVTSLRDPVERCFSHYLYLVRSGSTRQSFDEALRSHPALIDNSRYYKHLDVYFRWFERDRVGVLFFELLRADPRAYARQLFEFLGLDWCEDIDYERTVRTASRPRSFMLAKLLKMGANSARQLGLVHLVGAVKHSKLSTWLYPSYGKDNRPRMSESARRRLVEALREDSLRLRDLLGTELPAWSTLTT